MTNARANQPDDSPALHARELRHTYARRGRRSSGPIIALDGVSVAVDAGSFVALLGPNGSGKSTLMRICAGLLEPDSGSLMLFGEPLSASARLRLGVAFQSPGLDPHMTIRENLHMAAVLTGVPATARAGRIKSLLQALDLTDRADSRVKTLSGGLKRRADLCRALLHEPDILLLDEPTVGLDPRARQQFLDLVQQQHDELGLTVVMSTHLIEEADRADRVIMMDRGSIVADGSPGALCAEAGEARIIVHGGSFAPPADASHWTPTGDGWTCPVPADARERAELFETLHEAHRHFSLRPPTLADVFMERTGHTLAEENPTREAAA